MRLFTDVLREIRKGVVVDAASEALNTVVRGVMETGKAGGVTVQINIAPPKTRGDNALVVTAKVVTKEPRDDLPEAIFFASEDGDLLREDPTQTRMFAEADDGQPARRTRGE